MDVSQSTPQWAHYHAEVINWGLRRELGIYGTPSQAYTNSIPTNSLYIQMDNTPLHSILSACRPRGDSLCLSSSPSFLEGFSIQSEAIEVSQSASQGAHYHADVIYLPP